MLLTRSGIVIKAARTLDPGTIILDTGTIGWKRVEIHGAPITRYVDKGAFGTEGLRGKPAPERRGAEIPFAVGWLDRPSDVGARLKEGAVMAWCVAFAVAWEVVFKGLPSQLETAAAWSQLRR